MGAGGARAERLLERLTLSLSCSWPRNSKSVDDRPAADLRQRFKAVRGRGHTLGITAEGNRRPHLTGQGILTNEGDTHLAWRAWRR